MKSMSWFTRDAFELVFYSVLGIFSSALAITAFMQGVALQLATRDAATAFSYYIASMLALFGTLIIVLRSQRILSILTRPEFLSILRKK